MHRKIFEQDYTEKCTKRLKFSGFWGKKNFIDTELYAKMHNFFVMHTILRKNAQRNFSARFYGKTHGKIKVQQFLREKFFFAQNFTQKCTEKILRKILRKTTPKTLNSAIFDENKFIYTELYGKLHNALDFTRNFRIINKSIELDFFQLHPVWNWSLPSESVRRRAIILHKNVLWTTSKWSFTRDECGQLAVYHQCYRTGESARNLNFFKISKKIFFLELKKNFFGNKKTISNVKKFFTDW